MFNKTMKIEMFCILNNLMSTSNERANVIEIHDQTSPAYYTHTIMIYINWFVLVPRLFPYTQQHRKHNYSRFELKM